MPSDLPKNAIKFLAALLKHQAKQWLGEETLGVTSQTLVDIGGESLQKRMDAWLFEDETRAQLLEAAQRADQYFHEHCLDFELKQAFTLRFGDLPSVQEVLAILPQAMDAKAVTDALQVALARDVPSLSPAQCEAGARLYTEALLRAVSRLKNFTLPIIVQTLFDVRRELNAGQAEIRGKLDHILETIQQK